MVMRKKTRRRKRSSERKERATTDTTGSLKRVVIGTYSTASPTLLRL
jgi:hypothetical protein